jgi:predicted RNA-binding protein (virulence factor B family)
MIEIGRMNALRICKEVDFGVYLDGGDLGEILLPKKQIPDDANIDDMLNVFIYHDSNDRLIATTLKPYAMAGEFAILEVIDSNPVGTFFDWGLPKDLLMPFAEQKHRMVVGNRYLVRLFVDEETSRIAASALLGEFLDPIATGLEEKQEVDLIIEYPTDLGVRAIVNNRYWGMLYSDEIFQPLRCGDKLKGYIKQIRADGKLDIWLQKPGYKKIDALSQQILDHIKQHDGTILITDKSPPELIKKTFKTSKSSYKKAIGALYKAKLIVIENNTIRLI